MDQESRTGCEGPQGRAPYHQRCMVHQIEMRAFWSFLGGCISSKARVLDVIKCANPAIKEDCLYSSCSLVR